MAAGWTSLQPQLVSYVVCALLLPPCHLPNPLRAPMPPLVLLTLLLLWTVCIAHKTLFPRPSGFSLCDPKAAVPIPPFLLQSPGALRVWCSGSGLSFGGQ
jgi:hypothetical protein